MIHLSILIPTLNSRSVFLDKLWYNLERVCDCPILCDYDDLSNGVAFFSDDDNFLWHIEVLTNVDNGELSIGSKRNELLQRAKGDYVAFVDDDDVVTESYFKNIFEGIERKVDCCSLKGIITEDGINPLIFEHSIKYSEYKTNPDHMPVRYERFPNHLNTIRASIAKQFKFPEKNHGEDTDWATQIHKSGLIKSEYYIDEVIYHYLYRSKK